MSGGCTASYTTKCISNLEDFAQEMITHNYEADTLLLLHAADVSARNPFTKLLIYSPDTDVFLLTTHRYPVLCANTSFSTSTSGKQVRTIPVR